MNWATAHLPGHVVLPALVNAHDHLSLNHYPRTRPRSIYANAHDWGADVNALLDDPPFKGLRALPIRDRLFIGGLKNLLCGALTVMHHDPPHRSLFARAFPVRVIRRYTWAHSFGFTPALAIAKADHRTPPGAYFFIHLAEGTDDRAGAEYDQLQAAGAASRKTVLIHGVGLSAEQIARAAPLVRALVACPSTNRFLLGADPPIDAWRAAGGTVWLGSDSRLTADGDLLNEMALLAEAGESAATALTRLRPLMMPSAAMRDYIVIAEAAAMPLRRADLALVVRGGQPVIGAPELMAAYAHRPHVAATLDGAPKRIDAGLARQIQHLSIKEPGLALE